MLYFIIILLVVFIALLFSFIVTLQRENDKLFEENCDLVDELSKVKNNWI